VRCLCDRRCVQQLLLSGSHIHARGLRYLVLDEADYLMRPKFRPHVIALLQHMRRLRNIDIQRREQLIKQRKANGGAAADVDTSAGGDAADSKAAAADSPASEGLAWEQEMAREIAREEGRSADGDDAAAAAAAAEGSNEFVAGEIKPLAERHPNDLLNRQIAMVSATMTQEVKALADDYLYKPRIIAVEQAKGLTRQQMAERYLNSKMPRSIRHFLLNYDPATVRPAQPR
jgi:superfamily II DNA/RNA helicase